VLVVVYLGFVVDRFQCITALYKCVLVVSVTKKGIFRFLPKTNCTLPSITKQFLMLLFYKRISVIPSTNV